MLGLLVAMWMADPNLHAIVAPMLLASLPAFLAGLAEDLSKRVGVTTRLTATIASGALACGITGVAMQDTGMPLLDHVLQFTAIAVVFTAFAVGGVTNAINIIDGLNGLAAGAVSLMTLAIGVIALNLNDLPLANASFVVASAAMGFGLVNWPLGKLFMGDGGAYLLGFCLAWLAVLLPMRHAEIHAWTTLLVCLYPVLEVGFSIWRRYKRQGHHPGQPDHVHLHHLIFRRVARRHFPSLSTTLQNSMASVICWVLVATPASLAVCFAQNTAVLAAINIGFVFAYAAAYARLTQFTWCLSAATMQPKNPKLVNGG